MDKYSIRGKNKVNYNGRISELNYFYSIGFKKDKSNLKLKIYESKSDTRYHFFDNINILNMIDEIDFKLDKNDRIESVENYEDTKIKIKSKLIINEIRHPDLKDIIEYFENRIENEEDFLSMIMEIDFIEFLFGGNAAKRRVKNFCGIMSDDTFEVLIETEKEKLQEKYKYSLEKTYLNQVLLKYHLNNEETPKYYIEGIGNKEYSNNILASAKLNLKSGERNKFEREIILEIEKE